jgi:hypothetical protein
VSRRAYRSRERIVDTLFFNLRWDQYGFDKKHFRTRCAELVSFLHSDGFAGHIVHFGASGARIVDTIFFKLGWDRYEYDKNALGHIMLNLCFRIRWDPCVT